MRVYYIVFTSHHHALRSIRSHLLVYDLFRRRSPVLPGTTLADG